MISWPHHLRDALARRKAVLVIGSGISRNSVGIAGKQPPTWREFLERAFLELPARGASHIKRAIKSGDLLTACEWLKSRLGANWNDLLREEFLTPAYTPNDFHRALYKLDIRTVLTPNFDRIYDSYAGVESHNTVIVKTYLERDVSECLRANMPVILKYHGTIDSPNNMIFTRGEYARARVQHASFYRLLDALILTNTFLFVGCGTSDPDLQLLLEQYKFEQHQPPSHYIVLPGPVTKDLQ
jgi:hypothetical protein